VDRVLEAAIDIWGERRKRVSTGELNRLVSTAAERQTPPMVKGRRPKLFYATQVAVAPPTFVFFAREAGSVHFSYSRYLENRLREAFGFDGTPIRLVFRERSSVQLEKRRAAAKPTGPRGSRAGRGPTGARPTGPRPATRSGGGASVPRAKGSGAPAGGTGTSGPKGAAGPAGGAGTPRSKGSTGAKGSAAPGGSGASGAPPARSSSTRPKGRRSP